MHRAFSMIPLALLCTFLTASSLQAEGKEIIKDKSPDGKFALRIWKGEEGWDAAIVDLRSKKPVEYLDVYGNYVEGMRLVWSKDSKRVAHFEPDRRGGTTHIYFRNGSKFEEVPFPSGEVPKCDGNLTGEEEKKFVKTIEGTESPKAWLKSGALVIAVDESWITEDGGGSCSQTVTIAFDANRKAFVQSVTDKKVD
jgi:hypothetical protein